MKIPSILLIKGGLSHGLRIVPPFDQGGRGDFYQVYFNRKVIYKMPHAINMAVVEVSSLKRSERLCP
jgi:hypothetical protein